MDMDTEEKNTPNDSTIKKANEEYREILDEYSSKFDERMKELKKRGVQSHLDGKNHFKDIDDEFDRKIKALKEKYGKDMSKM